MKKINWLLCFTLFQIFTIMSLIAVVFIDSDQYTLYLQITSIITCMISYIALYMLYRGIMQKAQLEADNEILTKQIALQKEHSMAIQESQKQMQEIKTELLAKMNVTHPEAFTDEQTTRTYINELIAKSQRIQDLTYCQNKVIDAILYNKLLVAKSYDITCECETIIPQDLAIDALDLMRLWTNLIDNAIEATIQLPKEQRFLSIKGHMRAGFLAMQIANSKPMGQTIDLEHAKSTKSDKNLHGLGIGIIKDVVYQYHGNISVEDKDTIIYCNITLKNEAVK